YNPPSEGMEYTVVAQAPEEAAELWVIIWPRDETDKYVYAAGVATAVGDTEQDALNQVKEYFDGDSPSRYATAEEFLLRPEPTWERSEEHTSELQSRFDLVCRLLLEKKKSLTPNT